MRTKKVNIFTVQPLPFPGPRLTGEFIMDLTVEEIRKCITSGARVREVLADGTELPLSLSNYDVFHEVVTEVKSVEKKKEKEVIQEPIIEEVVETEVEESTEVIEDEPVVEEVENEAVEEVVETEVKEESTEEVVDVKEAARQRVESRRKK